MVVASGSVDAPLMLFAASFLICFGLLLFVNREDLAARQAESIKPLAVMYGRRISQRTAAASTPRMMAFLSLFAVSMGILALVILFYRLGAPFSPFTMGLTLGLGFLQVLVAAGLFTLRTTRFQRRASVNRRARSLMISGFVAGCCGVVTLAFIVVLITARIS
ncbi:hypothetical protein [uncultured Microbacterium sp.]|uniref:hypothetical protein n=1 Tax=uncultured Microbacterium sp. TaxID=191216 RepID=UPI0025E79491|nr:hypothetical protein [uncultured Microbacterium sp.]